MSQRDPSIDVLLVRLKPYDPRRGQVLRRFTYQGIKFLEERGWYVVDKAVADYLRKVHQREADPHSLLAFDVATEEDARALDARDEHEARTRKNAMEAPRVAAGRGDLTSDDLRAGGVGRTTVAVAASTPRTEADKPKKDRG